MKFRTLTFALLLAVTLLPSCANRTFRMTVEVDPVAPTHVYVAGENPRVSVINKGPESITLEFSSPDAERETLTPSSTLVRGTPGPIEFTMTTTASVPSRIELIARDSDGVSVRPTSVSSQQP